MPATIYNQAIGRSIVCLMGRDRQYVIGDVAYRFGPLSFVNLPTHTTGQPVTWIDGEWVASQLGRTIFVSIYREITPLK